MKIFLTGGTGFIGSHFINLAIEAGHTVQALRRNAISRPRIELKENPNWIDRQLSEVRVEDLTGCDALVHLASAGIRPRLASIEDLIQVNVCMSANLLDLAHRAGIRRVVVTGTCHEYGDSARDYSPIPADAPLRPLNLYGSSKSASFQIIYTLSRLLPLELYYGRIFSVFGPGQHEDNFYPQLIMSAQSGKDFEMTQGSQVRDFIDVTDVCNILLNGCERNDIRLGMPIIENIATGKSVSVYEFAKSIWIGLKATGELKRGMRPMPLDDVKEYSACIPHYMERFIKTSY